MNKSRIYSLDVFKLLLTYEIALGHLGIELPPSPGVAVDVFFMLSGFFLARKFYRTTDHEAYSSWDYTLDHVRTIYPHYIFSLGVFFLYNLLRSLIYLVLEPSVHSLWELGAYFYDQLADLVLMQSSHYFEKGLLYPTWQVSAMLISGYFIYELMHQNEKLTTRILLPASILMVQSLMYSGADYFDNYGFFYLPLLRAFSGLALGVLVFRFMGTKYPQKIYHHGLAMNIASLLGLAALMLYTDRARHYLIVIPFLLVVCLNPESWINRALNRKCFAFSGKLSLAVYMNHPFINRICETQILPRFGISKNMLGIIMVILLTIFSLITVRIVDWLTAIWHSKHAETVAL